IKETFTCRKSKRPFRFESTPKSECGGAKDAGERQVVRADVSETDRFHELVAVTIARSQPVAFGGIVTRTTNVALLPELRFPVAGTPSESVSGRGAVPSASGGRRTRTTRA